MTQLATNRFKPSEVVRNQWHVRPEHGTPPEALLDPYYWAHVSAQMTRGDIVIAFPDDNSFWMELLVIDAGKEPDGRKKAYAKLCQLRCVTISASQMLNIEVPEGFEIKFRGPRKWSVLKGKDVLKEDMEKSAAEQWLTDHIKTVHVKAVAA